MVSCLSVIKEAEQLGARSMSAVRNQEASARGSTSSVVISIGATASVRYREVVRSWEGPLWEVPLYMTSCNALLRYIDRFVLAQYSDIESKGSIHHYYANIYLVCGTQNDHCN